MPTVIDGDTGVSQVQNGVIVQADLASGVAGTGPAFSAYKNATQSFTQTSFTKVTFQLEEFDTASCFDTSTARFTPNVAGYYQVNGAIQFGTATAITCEIFKNGVSYKRGAFIASTYGTTVSCLVYLNGTTDYVEFYGYQAGATQSSSSDSTQVYFQASLVRAA